MAQPIPTLSVPIPDALQTVLLKRLHAENLRAWGVEALVVEAARQHIISRRKAATLLGYKNYDEREAFFERHGLILEYTQQMLEEDWKTIKASQS